MLMYAFWVSKFMFYQSIVNVLLEKVFDKLRHISFWNQIWKQINTIASTYL